MREYADVLTMRRLRKKREEKLGRPIPESKITDNSERWMEKPNSLRDYLWVSEQVNELVKRCRKNS